MCKITHILFREELYGLYLRLEIERAVYYYKNLQNRIPTILLRALVIAEDQRFYAHEGIDLKAILRAIWHYFQYRKIEGASTIEQQLVRVITNKYEKTLRRKIHEIMLASCIKKVLQKNEVLGLYLNIAYLGYQMRGVEGACKRLKYSLETLSPTESANIIARIRYPEPRIALDQWKELIKRRKDEIAHRLEEELLRRPIGKPIRKYEILLPGSEINKKLIERYPSSPNFREATKMLDEKGKEFLLRAFITEGIPAAFQESPLYFENIREFIAESLNIHPKNVILIGSARLGYSITPQRYGKEVNEKSDLDFCIISSFLFKESKDVFNRWKKDFERNKISFSVSEEQYWKENLYEVCPANIRNGFLDVNKVSNQYLLSSKMSKICEYVNKEINKSNNYIRPQKGISLRIYKDWESFFVQNVLNLNYTLQDI